MWQKNFFQKARRIICLRGGSFLFSLGLHSCYQSSSEKIDMKVRESKKIIAKFLENIEGKPIPKTELPEDSWGNQILVFDLKGGGLADGIRMGVSSGADQLMATEDDIFEIVGFSQRKQ